MANGNTQAEAGKDAMHRVFSVDLSPGLYPQRHRFPGAPDAHRREPPQGVEGPVALLCERWWVPSTNR